MSDIKKFAESAQKKAGMHSIKIKDKIYTISLLPATNSLIIATEIFKVVLPSFASLSDSFGKMEDIFPEDNNTYMEAALLLVNQMDKVSVLDIVNSLTNDVTCNGSQVNVDEEFKGNIGGLLTLLEFILKENIGPLFQEWLAEKGINLPSFRNNPQNQKEDISKSS